MNKLILSGFIVGILLILAGIVLLVLSYATKLFYTTATVTQSVAAGDSLSSGSLLLSQAAVAWDDTGIVLDTTGKFVKWSSTTSFRDTVGGPSYTCDLIPDQNGLITKVTSNTGLAGISMNGSCHLVGKGTATQTWASVPSYANDNTVIFAFSCPTTRTAANPSGMAFGNYDSPWILSAGQFYETYIDTAALSVNIVYALRPQIKSLQITGITSYTPVSNTSTVTSNISAFSYTLSNNKYYTYFNGVPVVMPNVVQVVPRTSYPGISIGRIFYDALNLKTVGTIHAAYIFNRVLTAAEIETVSTYLTQKYFAPALKYPASITVNTGTQLTDPISNPSVAGTAPITNYAISPSLLDGLTFNTTTGSISGTSTVTSPNTTYTITATNAIASASTRFTLESVLTAVNRVTTLPPTVTLTSHALIVDIGQAVVSPTPANTGGTIESFTITPAQSITDLNLAFNTTTGVISGTPNKNCDILFTITANNNGGTDSTTFRLQVGTTITYNPSSIRSKLGEMINPLSPTVSTLNGTIVSGYSHTGDLFGLSFDSQTGIISGKANTSGTSNVIVSITVNTRVITSTIHIVIDPDTQFKNKWFYVGGASGAIGLGVTLCVLMSIAVYWYYIRESSNSSNSSKSNSSKSNPNKPADEKPMKETPTSEKPAETENPTV